MAAETVEPGERQRKAPTLSVFLADDQSAVLAGSVEAVGSDGNLSLVGTSCCEGGTLTTVRNLRPDVVVLGSCVEGKENCLALCRRIKSLPDTPRVLVYAAPGFLGVIAGVAISGADGYLHKASPNLTLPEAIKRLAAGEEVWEFAPQAKDYKTRVFKAAKNNDFTPLEREIFDLMCEGMTNERIAGELHRSTHTIRDYARRILVKLEIEDRRHLYIPAYLLDNFR
jgi:two-component system, NarL family, response regulator DevR